MSADGVRRYGASVNMEQGTASAYASCVCGTAKASAARSSSAYASCRCGASTAFACVWENYARVEISVNTERCRIQGAQQEQNIRVDSGARTGNDDGP